MEPTRSDDLSDEALAKLGLSRETDIVLDETGRFFSGGALVAHPGVAAAFARWIERDPSGRYVLRNDLHYVYLRVEGAPLFVTRLELAPDAATLVLQGGEREPLRPETLREGPDGVLYVSARDGTWPARLLPRAALSLAPALREARDGAVELELAGRRYPIPVVDDPV